MSNAAHSPYCLVSGASSLCHEAIHRIREALDALGECDLSDELYQVLGAISLAESKLDEVSECLDDDEPCVEESEAEVGAN